LKLSVKIFPEAHSLYLNIRKVSINARPALQFPVETVKKVSVFLV